MSLLIPLVTVFRRAILCGTVTLRAVLGFRNAFLLLLLLIFIACGASSWQTG